MATDLSAKKNNFVARLIERDVSMIDIMDVLDDLRQEWTEAGFGAGGPAEITDADLAGQFGHIVAADLGNMMSTVDAFGALRAEGHGVNMQKLRS